MTKVVILAGGFGTRLSEETDLRPKPLVEIGGKPIIWHIMKIYAAAGFDEFVICCGYDFHKAHGKKATITSVPSPGRFGILDIDDNQNVREFKEKPHNEAGRINGGFFVMEPSAIDYVTGDDCIWEREPLEKLSSNGELSAFNHEGFWRPMDTLRDKRQLEDMWAAGTAPWKVW